MRRRRAWLLSCSAPHLPRPPGRSFPLQLTSCGRHSFTSLHLAVTTTSAVRILTPVILFGTGDVVFVVAAPWPTQSSLL
ncbi:hypothetical protein CC86DRAFT_15680 [Ophiobolus disseminans]|uniref:Uncharacterized protein n=1 Tax=Ophiobolus disseminans TaxID=1469910 RepID=A0A6A7AL03_9PLEO|nr:hypothetical protein CC86DRAFT_15680 [Ophiobolus disseminans]